jgi:secretion/DNA translocation related TadE-like protein
MTGRSCDGRRREQGAGSVLAIATIAVVMAAGAVGTAIAQAVAVRQVAAVAADASALAAAARARLGAVTACGSAAQVARADRTRLERCELSGDFVTVTVSAPPPALFAWLGATRLNALAGPAETYQEKPTPLAGPS